MNAEHAYMVFALRIINFSNFTKLHMQPIFILFINRDEIIRFAIKTTLGISYNYKGNITHP